jgi:hypothetical protein
MHRQTPHSPLQHTSLQSPPNCLANMFTGTLVLTNFAYDKRFDLAVIGEGLWGIL